MLLYGSFPNVWEERQTSQVVVDFGLAEASLEKNAQIASRGWIDSAILPELIH